MVIQDYSYIIYIYTFATKKLSGPEKKIEQLFSETNFLISCCEELFSETCGLLWIFAEHRVSYFNISTLILIRLVQPLILKSTFFAPRASRKKISEHLYRQNSRNFEPRLFRKIKSKNLKIRNRKVNKSNT